MEIFCKICLIILLIIKSFIHFSKSVAEENPAIRFGSVWGVIAAIIIECFLLWGAGVFNFGFQLK